ncbi:hypothetical protein FRB94_013660 [Tulasnella sp. JGI-2019a]|nr:hypothetical protein FRB94_013660 [Tulasnella sp. JGI-2019a]
MKGNAEDARAFGHLHCKNVTKTTIQPFKTNSQDSLDNIPAMKKQIDDFREVSPFDITSAIYNLIRMQPSIASSTVLGKSLIAASIARMEKASERLGAVFHLTRDDQARNKAAILIVARQLAFWQSGRPRSAIASAIEKDLDVAQMALVDQFEKLIPESLQLLDNTCPTMVMILDAMDECDQTYASLLKLIGKAFGKLPSAVKFFITARREPWMQSYYEGVSMKSHLEVFSLGDEKKEEVENDIEAFLKAKLPELVGSFVEDDLTGRVKKSERFLPTSRGGYSSSQAPPSESSRISTFATQMRSSIVSFHQIITRISMESTDKSLSARAQSRHQLRSFIGVIRLEVLDYLYAALIIPGVNTIEQAVDAQPIQFIHISFVDYLTDTTRCESALLVHLSEKHKCLAVSCFKTLEWMKHNIYDLEPSLLKV